MGQGEGVRRCMKGWNSCNFHIDLMSFYYKFCDNYNYGQSLTKPTQTIYSYCILHMFGVLVSGKGNSNEYPQCIICFHTEMSRDMTKTNKVTVRPAKTQISLGIRPVWSESSLCAQWVAKDPSFLHANREDSDQTGQMPRLIRVFTGHTCHFVGFVMKWLKYWKLS